MPKQVCSTSGRYWFSLTKLVHVTCSKIIRAGPEFDCYCWGFWYNTTTLLYIPILPNFLPCQAAIIETRLLAAGPPLFWMLHTGKMPGFARPASIPARWQYLGWLDNRHKPLKLAQPRNQIIAHDSIAHLMGLIMNWLYPVTGFATVTMSNYTLCRGYTRIGKV